MRILDHEIGNHRPLFLIAGPCVIESEEIVMECAEQLAAIRDAFHMLVIFKASFDKANRTSMSSYRGVGIDDGLAMLAAVRNRFGLPVLTDVHEIDQIAPAAAVVDVLQTPALLARQTDFIQAVAMAGKPVNIKKGQFMAPEDMGHVVEKCRGVFGDDVMLCERGTSFGYHDLIVDMRGLARMAAFGRPVVFDATHSVQRPAGDGHKSGGDRAMVPTLARAAVAAGVAGIFMETHPNPDLALSDGPNMVPLGQMAALVAKLIEIDTVVKI